MVEDDKRLLREGINIEVEEELAGRFYTTLKFPIFREGRTPLLGGFTIDITKRKEAELGLQAALREKEILLGELQHRVKNSLMLVSSLLSLATASMPEGKGRDVLLDTQSRIESMQAIYELLCASPGIDEVDLADYLGRLAEKLRASWSIRGRLRARILVHERAGERRQGHSPRTYLHRAFTNAMKHSRTEGGSARMLISVSLAKGAGRWSCAYLTRGPASRPASIQVPLRASASSSCCPSLRSWGGMPHSTPAQGRKWCFRFLADAGERRMHTPDENLGLRVLPLPGERGIRLLEYGAIAHRLDCR